MPVMQKILDENYYDFIIDNTIAPKYSTEDNITLLNDDHSLLHISRSVMDVCDIGDTPYYAFPSIYTLASFVSDENPTIKMLQPALNYNLLGQCMLVGIVDTGIDYQHPAFRNADGSTRILSIWDQSDQSGISRKVLHMVQNTANSSSIPHCFPMMLSLSSPRPIRSDMEPQLPVSSQAVQIPKILLAGLFPTANLLS